MQLFENVDFDKFVKAALPIVLGWLAGAIFILVINLYVFGYLLPSFGCTVLLILTGFAAYFVQFKLISITTNKSV